jgi:transcriptional regulator with XRE-family HTH domain
MMIGERLKVLRQHKGLSQGDVAKRSGLLRCYISRVENGHTVPSVDTVGKLALALEVRMYEPFYDGERPPTPQPPITDDGWGSSGREARTLGIFRRLMRRANPADRKLLLFMAQKMSRRRRRRSGIGRKSS